MSAVELEKVSFAGAAASTPRVFVRRISAPAAAPWEQRRAAELEARLAAPLPNAEVVCELRRIGVWRFRQPGRYLACYVRSAALDGAFETWVEAEGARRKVTFRNSAQGTRATGMALATVVIGAVCGLLVVSAYLQAATMRGAADERLDTAANLAAASLHGAERRHSFAQEQRCLARVGASGRALGDVLRDLAWAASHKTTDLRLNALHWQGGLLALEARGGTRPFGQDVGGVMKSPRPIGPATWLWGVRVSSPSRADTPARCSIS